MKPCWPKPWDQPSSWLCCWASPGEGSGQVTSMLLQLMVSSAAQCRRGRAVLSGTSHSGGHQVPLWALQFQSLPTPLLLSLCPAAPTPAPASSEMMLCFPKDTLVQHQIARATFSNTLFQFDVPPHALEVPPRRFRGSISSRSKSPNQL